MSRSNPGVEFDDSLLRGVVIDKPAVERYVGKLRQKKMLDKEEQIAWLLRAVTCIDLTTLCGDDCQSNVSRLCHKAVRPIEESLLEKLGFGADDIRVAAVCVYPSQVANCSELMDFNIPIASVAAGFPCGQYPLSTRLREIELAVSDGASEIDIVISRSLVLEGKFQELYREVQQMRKACGDEAHLKTILAVGELGSLVNVYKASMVCMMSGADFIKTSTGKEAVNATLPSGLVMARAIRDYEEVTGFKVGFKPAGGIRTSKDALQWQMLMEQELGNPWLFPSLFRIGASGLLGNIEKTIFNYVTGYYPSSRPFAFV